MSTESVGTRHIHPRQIVQASQEMALSIENHFELSFGISISLCLHFVSMTIDSILSAHLLDLGEVVDSHHRQSMLICEFCAQTAHSPPSCCFIFYEQSPYKAFPVLWDVFATIRYIAMQQNPSHIRLSQKFTLLAETLKLPFCNYWEKTIKASPNSG